RERKRANEMRLMRRMGPMGPIRLIRLIRCTSPYAFAFAGFLETFSRWARRLLVRLAALRWITPLVPARSSFLAARRNSVSALAASPAAAAARTFLTSVFSSDFVARFFARRSRL